MRVADKSKTDLVRLTEQSAATRREVGAHVHPRCHRSNVLRQAACRAVQSYGWDCFRRGGGVKRQSSQACGEGHAYRCMAAPLVVHTLLAFHGRPTCPVAPCPVRSTPRTRCAPPSSARRRRRSSPRSAASWWVLRSRLVGCRCSCLWAPHRHSCFKAFRGCV